MAVDSMRLEAPAAQQELELLKSLKVGDIRHSVLFPALDADLEWACVVASADRWEFDGRFLGQPLFRAVIVLTPTALMLDVKEMP